MNTRKQLVKARETWLKACEETGSVSKAARRRVIGSRHQTFWPILLMSLWHSSKINTKNHGYKANSFARKSVDPIGQVFRTEQLLPQG